MTFAISQDCHFFQRAVLTFSSSLDLSRAMGAAFTYLQQHFPLAALSLHRFEENLGGFRLLFLVSPGKFHYLDQVVPLHGPGREHVRQVERERKILYIPHSENGPGDVSRRLSVALGPYLTYRDRAFLVAMLSTNEKTVGHLVLFSHEPASFTPDHEAKLALLTPAFSLALINMLHYREVLELQQRLVEENRLLTAETLRLKQTSIIGANEGLRKVMDRVELLAGRDVPVLISGETGTGKEVIADAIQRISSRYQAPYIKVNCGAIPDSLIDSELFGHEKGAFTGAVTSRPGRFEQANGGTLFLDEVGDMPLPAQRRLLRVLQDGIVQRLGSPRTMRVDVRIIGATHRDLENMIRDGSFRQDLYYRLNVFPLRMPALRERIQDIPALIHYFVRRKAHRLKLTRTPLVAGKALQKLLEYPWPGNVRQLANLVEQALILDPKGPLRLDLHLPDDSRPYFSAGHIRQPAVRMVQAHGDDAPTDLEQHIRPATREASPSWRKGPLPTLDQAMADHIVRALQISQGKVHGPGGAAELLGVNPNTLRKRMDKLGVPYGRRWKGRRSEHASLDVASARP